MGVAGVDVGVVATFCIEDWPEEGLDEDEAVGRDDGFVNGEPGDNDDTVGVDEEEPVKGELGEGELFDEPKGPELELEELDELIEVDGCSNWHIAKSESCCMQVNAAFQSVPKSVPNSVPEQSGPTGIHDV